MSNERLQELEDEVKVLKNEIKQTLLDIQEHLLTTPAAPMGGALPPAPPEEALAAAPPPASAGAGPLDWAPEAERAEAERAPMGEPRLTGKAGATEPADTPWGPAAPPNGAPPGAPQGPSTSTTAAPDLRTVARLTQWVGATVGAIGQERMGAVLELYELLAQVPEPVGRALLGLARLEAGSCACAPAGERAPRCESLAALLELTSLLSGRDNGHASSPLPAAWAARGKEARHR